MIVAIPRHSLLLCAASQGCCCAEWCLWPSKTSRTITSQVESSKPPAAPAPSNSCLPYWDLVQCKHLEDELTSFFRRISQWAEEFSHFIFDYTWMHFMEAKPENWVPEYEMLSLANLCFLLVFTYSVKCKFKCPTYFFFFLNVQVTWIQLVKSKA